MSGRERQRMMIAVKDSHFTLIQDADTVKPDEIGDNLFSTDRSTFKQVGAVSGDGVDAQF
mgnify:CR=1 FL=1